MKCRVRYDGYRIWMYNCYIGKVFGILGGIVFLGLFFRFVRVFVGDR